MCSDMHQHDAMLHAAVADTSGCERFRDGRNGMHQHDTRCHDAATDTGGRVLSERRATCMCTHQICGVPYINTIRGCMILQLTRVEVVNKKNKKIDLHMHTPTRCGGEQASDKQSDMHPHNKRLKSAVAETGGRGQQKDKLLCWPDGGLHCGRPPSRQMSEMTSDVVRCAPARRLAIAQWFSTSEYRTAQFQWYPTRNAD
jgi:hypothetical protein